MKKCSDCKLCKDLSEFGNSARSADGKRQHCLVCNNLRSRNAKYKNRYGISAVEADEMKAGGCEICGSHVKMVIDHDHTSGAVRGALCHQCNTAIGMMRDDPELLRRAADYLEKS